MKRLVFAFILLAAFAAMVSSQGAGTAQTARRLGRAYYEEGKYQPAVEQFRKVLQLQPRGQAAFADHLNLGLALMSLPDEAGALSELETALQMRPGAPEVLYALGILNKRQGRFPQSLDYLQQLQKQGRADMATDFNAGAVLMAMNRPQEAIAYFRKVLARGFDFGPSWYLAAEFRLSRLLQRLGQAEEAARTFKSWETRRAAMKEPNDSPTTLEQGPLLKPQTPPDSMTPLRQVVKPVFVARTLGAPAMERAAFPIVRFDYDVDGDVDELSIPGKCGALRLRRNNGNGTFTDVTAGAGLGIPGGKQACAVAVADLDGDSDTDIIAAGPDGAWFFSNERGGKFKLATPFGNAAGTEIAAADFEGNGKFDMAFATANGLVIWWNSTRQLERIEGGRAPFTVADLNGDGLLDIASASGKQVQFCLNQGGRRFERSEGPPAAAAITALDTRYGAADGTLWLLARAGGATAFERTSPKAHWLRFDFDGVRSNKEGIGALVEVKSGDFYTVRQVGREPLVIDTGDLAKVNVVRVTWPNGIIQNVIETATDKKLAISEQDRLASSCPLLYLWDGRQFRFFAEVLSRTPLGEPNGRGGYILPGREESVFLPGDMVIARDGRYVFQLTEELREAIYLDQARLIALDHPAGTRAFVDEAYRGAPVASQPLGVRNATAVHFQRLPASPREDSLPGLMEKHAIYFDLPAGTEFVVLRGWTYWMDSNIATAAAQDPVRAALPPRLEMRQPDGTWRALLDDVGLPAGAGRYVVADLRGRIPAAGGSFRVATNLRVNWSEVLAASGAADLRAAPAAAPTADLHFRGFSEPTISPTRSSPDHYDYSRLMKTAPWNPLPGRYTRYGDVRPLLAGADDRLVVFGAGDELTLEFPVSQFPPLKPGWTRDFVLELTGWAKAGETNTASSATVEPLPYRAMKHYPYRQSAPPAWQQRWLTRRPMPLLPPLAPAW